MNTSRMLVLGGAGVAAIVAVLLVRSMLGGGTPAATAAIPPPSRDTQVLVADSAIQPGTPLNPDLVRWQSWPKSSVDSSFITQEAAPNLNLALAGTVVRAPIVSGEPITTSNIVHANASGIMAAILTPGMRAVSIGISTESGAGGFILPNDRVDVIQTHQVGDAHDYHARTILNDVRVLAVDQTYQEDKDQKVVLAKTATLELWPRQAEMVERAQAGGTLSLSLRGLTDSNPANASNTSSAPTAMLGQGEGDVTVLRYGVERSSAGAQRE